MPVNEIKLSSPIEEKIVWAEHCFKTRGEQLLGEAGIRSFLEGVKEAVRASHREMAESGVMDECRNCEDTEGGSCCGKGLENRYSGILLLINLLLGIKLPKEPLDPSGCFFLGNQGCLLLARHVICVNYLCRKVTDRIHPEKIAALREKEGVELERLFFLNERIKKVFNA